MNINLMSFLVGKAVADKLGEERSTQLGLIAGVMPGYQGVMISALIASREETPPAKPAADPKSLHQQAETLREFFDQVMAEASRVAHKSALMTTASPIGPRQSP